MERVNSLFFQSTRPEHFATLFFGVYEANGRTMRYVNCGHPAPVLLRRNGSSELLNATATVLGAFQGSEFEERKLSLDPGDRVVLFSDGFSEAAEDETWAAEAVQRLGRAHSSDLAGVLASAAASLGEQADDITVMDIRAL